LFRHWFTSKVGRHTWIQSVPSAVADGHEVEALNLVRFLNPKVDPSATADGTDYPSGKLDF
jgi:hypothetical protein